MIPRLPAPHQCLRPSLRPCTSHPRLLPHGALLVLRPGRFALATQAASDRATSVSLQDSARKERPINARRTRDQRKSSTVPREAREKEPEANASSPLSARAKRGRTDGPALPSPPPFIIIGSQTILNTLQTNPKSIEEIVIDAGKLKNPRISTIAHLAEKEGITLKEATTEQVNRLSKNSRQDQGIVARVKPLNIVPFEEYLDKIKFGPAALVALDGVTNPQNIGLMLRSFAAGGYINGVIIPRYSCPPASHPLVIKASAGTVLHSSVKILDCRICHPFLAPPWIDYPLPLDRSQVTVEEAVLKCNLLGFSVVGLDQRGSSNIFEYNPPARVVYVIGNESKGLSVRLRHLLTKRLRIPMAPDVESLNVAVAASFIGYLKQFRSSSPTLSASAIKGLAASAGKRTAGAPAAATIGSFTRTTPKQ